MSLQTLLSGGDGVIVVGLGAEVDGERKGQRGRKRERETERERGGDLEGAEAH
jgi:hypothetical protein